MVITFGTIVKSGYLDAGHTGSRFLILTYLAPLKILLYSMEYSKLVAVTGLPGLFELLNSKSDGAIVRSIDDNSTRFASSRKHQFSHLESIEVYTVRENVNLVEIFQAMDKAGETLPDTKDAGQLHAYFSKVFPDLDFDRVYNSDLKKMVKWFEQLKKKNIEIKLTEVPVEEEPAEEPAPVVEKEKPAKKAAKKEETESAEDKPAKKTAVKKTKKEKEEKAPKAEKEKPAKKSAAKEEKEEAPKKKAAPKKK